MAVKTIWPITHACGHTEDRDLSGKRADERAGYANWLASKDCTNCWRASQGDTSERLSTDEWIAQQRAAERAEIDAWETRCAMPPLDGSEKAVDWGRRARHTLLTTTYEALVHSGALTEDAWLTSIEAPARTVLRASWWIDQREADPSDVEELLTSATSATSTSSTENPY